MTEAPTSGELTRAWALALKGASKITEEERAFIRDVIRRDVTAETDRTIAFLRRMLP